MPDAMTSVRVLAVRPHQPHLVTLVLPRLFSATPGQFVFTWRPGFGEKPFSISDLDDDTVSVTIRVVGDHTRALAALAPGDLLGVRGPFGRGFSGPWSGEGTEAPRARVLVAGGIGVAPVHFLARALRRAGEPYTLLVGARTASELCLVESLEALGARFVTDDGSFGTRALVTAPLDELLGPGVLVQACGPEPMLLATRRIAAEKGATGELSFERTMKCGLGICGQCCGDGTGIRLCVEGPVLDDAETEGLTDLGLPHRDATGRRASASSKGPP